MVSETVAFTVTLVVALAIPVIAFLMHQVKVRRLVREGKQPWEIHRIDPWWRGEKVPREAVKGHGAMCPQCSGRRTHRKPLGWEYITIMMGILPFVVLSMLRRPTHCHDCGLDWRAPGMGSRG